MTTEDGGVEHYFTVNGRKTTNFLYSKRDSMLTALYYLFDYLHMSPTLTVREESNLSGKAISEAGRVAGSEHQTDAPKTTTTINHD